MSRKLTVVTHLGPDDVLFGKGSPSCGNSGNIRFRAVVKLLLPLYVSTPRRSEKDRLARAVVDIIKSRNGRFLRRIHSPSEADRLNLATYEGVWLLVDEKLMIPKVKQTFRDQHSGASKIEAPSAWQVSEIDAGLNRRNTSIPLSALLSPRFLPSQEFQNGNAVPTQRLGIELRQQMPFNANVVLQYLQQQVHQQRYPVPFVEPIRTRQMMYSKPTSPKIDDGLQLLAVAASRSTRSTLPCPKVLPSETSKNESTAKPSI
eukprot:scaffold35012_cov214-Amphora_coffeaeformis.AAC.1